MSRHAWDKRGRWGSSHHNKTCTKCGIVAHKTGLYGGYSFDHPDWPKQRWTERLPECPTQFDSQPRPPRGTES